MTFGIGLIGAGSFGAVHAAAIAGQPDARLVAVCSGNPETAAAFVAQHGGVAHRDWRHLLESPEVDAVVIATPHDHHVAIAIAALASGRHVLLEKPMAPTVALCREIEAAAAAAPGLLMIGHVMHFFRPVLAARALLDEGSLGRPLAGTSGLVKLWMEANRRRWHLEPETGGGMLMTAGIHALDQFIWLMDGRIAAVSAMAGTLFHDQPADDIAFLNLRFADGRLGQVTSLGYRDGAVTNGMRLVCEHGVIDVDLDRGVRVGRGARWTDIADSWEPDGMAAAVSREWRAFLDAIATASPSPVPAAYGRHIVAAIEAALASAQARAEVAVAG
jgi:phthalate 4,5-cis-dihydrodiol dehydrogenase